MLSRRELANAIRALSMDAVQRANSGHPGAPMGMADIAEVLWNDFLKHNPNNPNWDNRDRFIMSNGHGSMLIYALLHLTGYGLSISTDGGTTFTNKTTADGLAANSSDAVFISSNGTIYVGTGNGLSISTDAGLTFTSKTIADGLNEDFNINDISQVSTGEVIITTSSGIYIQNN